MSDFSIPLDGKPVRVWSHIIQQAVDHLALTKADYVTLTVVGDTCVSLYTGKPPSPPIPSIGQEARNVFMPRAGRSPKKAGRSHKKITKNRKITKKVIHDADYQPYSARIDTGRILQIISDYGRNPFSTKDIGDRLGFDRKDVNMRAALTLFMQELRISGIIAPTSNSRVPDYLLHELISVTNEPASENSIVKFLSDIQRPLTGGVIADHFNISRADKASRQTLKTMLLRMRDNGKIIFDNTLQMSTYAV